WSETETVLGRELHFVIFIKTPGDTLFVNYGDSIHSIAYGSPKDIKYGPTTLWTDTHIYQAPGDYTVRYRVADSSQFSADSFLVHIKSANNQSYVVGDWILDSTREFTSGRIDRGGYVALRFASDGKYTGDPWPGYGVYYDSASSIY